MSAPRGIFVGDAFVVDGPAPGPLAEGRVLIEGLPGSITDLLARVERLDGTAQVARLLPDSRHSSSKLQRRPRA